MELFENPHTLDCGHSYCGVCLVQWLTTRKQCPECRHDVVRRPIPSYVVQQQVDAVRPFLTNPTQDPLATNVSTSFANSSMWAVLFPIDNKHTFIIDVDDDNVRRCGQCIYELDADGRCPSCDTVYHGARIERISDDSEGDEVGFHNEDNFSDSEEDGSIVDFVVDDTEIIYDDESDFESDQDGSVSSSRRHARRITLSDDESDNIDNSPNSPVQRIKTIVLDSCESDQDSDNEDNSSITSSILESIEENMGISSPLASSDHEMSEDDIQLNHAQNSKSRKRTCIILDSEDDDSDVAASTSKKPPKKSRKKDKKKEKKGKGKGKSK
ncbi:hypothetical protein CLU79DRAFT_463857 [Phycomyces nitens]|nr:hypothetical protein CLU79DRAFT_463857 [Phycomyces nitens]